VRATIAALMLGAVLASVVPAPSLARGNGRVSPACKLLERSEIAAVLGVEVQRARKGRVGTSCVWKVAGGSGEGGGEIATFLERGRSVRRSFRLARTVAGDDEVPIRDLGRSAFFALDTVYVLETKRTLIYVQGVFTDSSTVDVTDLQASLVELARIAVDRPEEGMRGIPSTP
jgi:hypothetical protein